MLGSVDLAPWSIVIVDTWMWTPFVMLIKNSNEAANTD